ncbi:MAG: alpha-1,2-fucosyltransferase, partial [Ferrovum sp. 34-44-207]
MIITRLIGGLGNQIFQYAVGRAVAARTNTPLLLDASGFPGYELRRYELDGFNVRAELVSAAQLARVGVTASAPHSLLERIKLRFFSQSTQKLPLREPILREASFTYDTRIEYVQAPIYLDGYWQSERYFSAIRMQLLQELTLKNEWGVGNEDMFAQIQAAGLGAVSLHVRRGDYVTNSHTATYHGVCSLDYYRAAVAYIAERVAAPHFFIFSDDHDWVSTNLQTGFPTTFVSVNSADHGIYDMMLMKTCRHHVIANSSFSWWGAWLNPYQDKIVVAPQRWFSGASHDISDLIPASW